MSTTNLKGRFRVETSRGTRFLARTTFIAVGVGSFQPRLLKRDGLSAHQERQVYYQVTDLRRSAGKNLVIVGGGDSAIDWALEFARDGRHRAKSVILLHRRDDFKAEPASVAKMRALCNALEMHFIV